MTESSGRHRSLVLAVAAASPQAAVDRDEERGEGLARAGGAAIRVSRRRRSSANRAPVPRSAHPGSAAEPLGDRGVEAFEHAGVRHTAACPAPSGALRTGVRLAAQCSRARPDSGAGVGPGTSGESPARCGAACVTRSGRRAGATSVSTAARIACRTSSSGWPDRRRAPSTALVSPGGAAFTSGPHGPCAHSGMLPCLRLRRSSRLRREHLEALREHPAGLGGVDDVVDVAAFGGDVGIREALGVLRDELGPAALRVGRLGELSAVRRSRPRRRGPSRRAPPDGQAKERSVPIDFESMTR